MKIGIIFPVYNEEARLEDGIKRTFSYIDEEIKSECNVYIIDNGSTDKTGEIARYLTDTYAHVFYYRIEEKGVGAAFRKGVSISRDDVIGYMDVDLATDISHLREVERLFCKRNIEIVNASRFSRKSRTSGRRWYRNITSYGLIFLLKISLNMKATDAICGFKFFRRDTVIELINVSSRENGWFYIIELLLRAERENRRIYELPVRWKDDAKNSKVDMFKVISSYLIGIRKLRVEFFQKKKRE